MNSRTLNQSWQRLFCRAAARIAIIVGALAALAPAASAHNGESLESLHRQKLIAARDWCRAELVAWEAGTVTISEYYAASIAWKEAAYELASNPQQRIQVLEAHRDRMIALQKENDDSTRLGGNLQERDVMIRFVVLEAKIWIAEEVAKQKQPKEH